MKTNLNRTPVGSIDAGGDLTARANQDITRIALNIQGSGTVRFWDNPSEQSWTNFFGTYPRATLRLQFEIPGPAYELTRGGQGGNFSNWSTSNTAARAAIASARANGKKFIFLLAEERIMVRAGEGERASALTAGKEGVGRGNVTTLTGVGEKGAVSTDGASGTGNAANVVNSGSGEDAAVGVSGKEGTGRTRIITRTGSGEAGTVISSGMEGEGQLAGKLTGTGEAGTVSTTGAEGVGGIVGKRIGTGEAGTIAATGAEGTGRTPLSLSDSDDTGLSNIQVKALLVASAPGTAGNNLYADSDRGGT